MRLSDKLSDAYTALARKAALKIKEAFELILQDARSEGRQVYAEAASARLQADYLAVFGWKVRSELDYDKHRTAMGIDLKLEFDKAGRVIVVLIPRDNRYHELIRERLENELSVKFVQTRGPLQSQAPHHRVEIAEWKGGYIAILI